MAASGVTGQAPTLQLGQLTGTWAAVYRRRDRLEAEAAEQVLTAWRTVAAGLDLTAVMTALRQQLGLDESEADVERRRHIQQVTAAAVLAQLVGLTRHPGWDALIATLTALLRRSRSAGKRAGGAVLDDDPDQLADEDADEDDGDPDEDTAAAYDITAAALHGTSQTIARALLNAAEQGDDERAMQDQADAALTDGAAWTLAAGTAAAAAFTAGLTATYLARGAQQLGFVTAGARVCPSCASAEAGNPWPAATAPRPPLHPNCRCTVQPIT